MRVGRDFRDPYALNSLYVPLVRNKLEYASYVWMPYQNGRIARLKRLLEKFILYALLRLGWMDGWIVSSGVALLHAGHKTGLMCTTVYL
jgi:hypothetical protein